MTPFYLKFADKEQAIAAGLLVADVQDGEIIKQTSRYFIHSIGIIPLTSQTGVDEDGNAKFTTTELDGYHINVLIDELPHGLEGYRVMPTTPFRVFAGV